MNMSAHTRIAGLVLACLLLGAPAFAGTPERALCVVCQVDEGGTFSEPVRATRTHGDRQVLFCSERCARIFEKNPHRYLGALAAAGEERAVGAAPADSLFALGLPGGGHVATTPT